MAFPVWLIGVLLAVVSAVISNLGLNLQKRNHLNNSAATAKVDDSGKADGRKESSHHHHSHHSHHHRHRHRTTSGSSAGKEKDRQRKKHRVQPNDILVKSATSAAAADQQALKEEESFNPSSAPSTEVKRRRRKKKGASSMGGDKGARAPLLEVRVQGADGLNGEKGSKRYQSLADSSADDVGIQELLSASSSYFLHPAPTHVEAAASPSASSVDGAVSSAAAPPSYAAATSDGGGHSSADDAAASINYTRQLTWQCGLALVILGSLFDFAALAFASQSQIAPLGSLTLVSNVFLAPLLLKETLSRRDVVCTLVIVAGAFLAVLCAAHDDGALTVSEMFGYFLHVQFVLYAAVVVVAVLALRVMTWKAGLLRRRAHTSREAARKYQANMKFHRFGYAAAAGIMGAQSVLFAKCTSTLFRATVSGEGVMFLYPGTYAVLAGLGVTIFFQIRWLNSGLRLFPALYVVPVFQSFWILVSVISGMVFFEEWQGVLDEPLMAFGFCSGLGLTIGGVYVLSQKAGHDKEEVEQSSAATGGLGASDRGAVDELEPSQSALNRRDSASSSSSIEAFVHHRSRSLSGDRDFDDGHGHSHGGHGHTLLHLHLHPSAQSAFKQPLLGEEEKVSSATAHVTPTRLRRSHPSPSSSSGLPSSVSPASSAAAGGPSAFISPYPLPFHHSLHHHLSPLPESLTPSAASDLRQRVDSDPVERHRRMERVESAPLPSDPVRPHQPSRGHVPPPVAEIDPVLPSYSFSHPTEFLQVPSPAAVPVQRSRSASIGHVGEEILSALSQRLKKGTAKTLNFSRALSALVSPQSDTAPPQHSPRAFRRPSWHEISHNAALNAPGLSAFAHAMALRNYERYGDREDEDDSPREGEDTSDCSDQSSSEGEEGDEEGEEDEEGDEDDEGEEDDEEEDEEEGEGVGGAGVRAPLQWSSAAGGRVEEARAASGVGSFLSARGGVLPRPPLASSASAVASAPSTDAFSFPALPSSSTFSAAPSAAAARPPLTDQHRVRLAAAQRSKR